MPVTRQVERLIKDTKAECVKWDAAEVSNINATTGDAGCWGAMWGAVTKKGWNRAPALGKCTPCAAAGCSRDARVGAHVWKLGVPARNHGFIVPFWGHHNSEAYDWDGRQTSWVPLKRGTAAVKIIAHSSWGGQARIPGRRTRRLQAASAATSALPDDSGSGSDGGSEVESAACDALVAQLGRVKLAGRR